MYDELMKISFFLGNSIQDGFLYTIVKKGNIFLYAGRMFFIVKIYPLFFKIIIKVLYRKKGAKKLA